MRDYFKNQPNIMNSPYLDIFGNNCFYIPSFFNDDIDIYKYLMEDVSFAFNPKYGIQGW